MVRFRSVILLGVMMTASMVFEGSLGRGADADVLEREEMLKKLRALEQLVLTLETEVKDLATRLKETRHRLSLTSHRLPEEVVLCGERIPLENRTVWENLDREFLLTLSNEAQVLLWIKRSKRYFPHLEQRLKEMGLPDDLKFVPIVESGLRPYAVSSSGAAGIWQFIPSTGEKFEMRKNRYLDERFDFYKATDGALLYLKSLYEEFGNWALALAAYNIGESRIRKEVEIQRTRDYYFLDLPLETERYVYKIAVAKMILSEPGRYGFHLEEKDCYEPLEVERVQIEVPQPLPIIEISMALGRFYKEVRRLNPHFSEESIPPGVQFINLPMGTSATFYNFFSAWKAKVVGR